MVMGLPIKFRCKARFQFLELHLREILFGWLPPKILAGDAVPQDVQCPILHFGERHFLASGRVVLMTVHGAFACRSAL
jgi:hypothetical protein